MTFFVQLKLNNFQKNKKFCWSQSHKIVLAYIYSVFICKIHPFPILRQILLALIKWPSLQKGE